jgi:hypothetical protein
MTAMGRDQQRIARFEISLLLLLLKSQPRDSRQQ